MREEGIEKFSEAGLMPRGSRYKAELTQKELAEKLGVKPHHISEMENGKRPIGKKNGPEAVCYFGCALQGIFLNKAACIWHAMFLRSWPSALWHIAECFSSQGWIKAWHIDLGSWDNPELLEMFQSS